MIDEPNRQINEPWKETLNVQVERVGSQVRVDFERADGSCRSHITLHFGKAVYWKLLSELLLLKKDQDL